MGRTGAQLRTPQMIEALHPGGKSPTRVNKPAYEAFRRAILRVVPRSHEGVAFRELPDLVTVHLPEDYRRKFSVMWWTTTVKLDLEARGLIERVPGATPQRVRRTK
ncbi:MAG: DUF6958 family protein [Phycisphaerales bacterium JB039]